MRPRLVLVMPKSSYRAEEFLAAAERAGAEVLVASDRCHVLDGVWRWPPESLVIDDRDPAAAARTIVAAARSDPARPVAAVLATEGELAVTVAARAAAELGLGHNAVAAAEAARDKHRMRSLCQAAGVRVPRFELVTATGHDLPHLGFPCVLKPTFLSASRGVLRADDEVGFAEARARIARILARPEVRAVAPDAADHILVEEFVPGLEVAFEGLLHGGELVELALFDKPDPLYGPTFEETIYVTPSRLPEEVRRSIHATTAAAARAMGLVTGPVHAELRLPPARSALRSDGHAPGGPVVIEVAARSIGGLCSRVLRFGAGLSLEDVLVRHALGQVVAPPERERTAAGVMMLPIPRAGVLAAVRGLERARAVCGVDDVVISTALGTELVPLPEGHAYLGFAFARGRSAEQVERALRDAHAALELEITPKLPTV